jgi:hypothetical protein
VRDVRDNAVAYFLSIIYLQPPKNIFVFALADDPVDFDSVIPWFESWRPSQQVLSLRGCQPNAQKGRKYWLFAHG